MKAEIKFEESEEEIQEILTSKMQKDLEMRLIAELREKLQLQELEKKVAEDEGAKKWQQEEAEEHEEAAHEYGIEVETAYSKIRSAYHTEQPYEKNHGNQAGYENKQ